MRPTPPPRAGRREWIGLAVIALPCLLYSMDLTVLFLAVPELSADLEPSSSQLLWISDIYGFLLAGLLITMGTLGDRVGRRRLLMIGAAAFGAASVLAAFSTTAEMLIASRALLGVAAATLAPSTLSLIRNMFLDDRQRTTAIAVWVTSFSAGAAIGPIAGGALLEFFWWGSVFLLAVPVMALLLVVGPRLLPEFRDPDAGRLDLLSAAQSLVAVLAVIFGIKRIAEGGLETAAVASILLGLAVGAVFIRRQRRLEEPLVDLRLFRTPAFSAALGMNTAALLVVFGGEFLIAQYLQLVLGLSPLEAGLWTLPSAAGFIVGSMLAPAVVRRVRPGLVVAGGLALAAAGFVLLTRVDGASGLGVVVAGSVLLALGASPVVTLSTDLIVGAAPPERAGVASGLSETGAELGGALGIAILGSIGAAVYRREVADEVPEGVPADAADAARDTLGGALGAAEDLPGRLLDAATDAFAQGFQMAAAVSAVLMAGLAAVALRVLRGAGGNSGNDA
jgi:DHA2 family multidrug resistance protein-like MFS transporter